jgi:DNA-directed RNA polymerase specialized sigma24 family protein
MNTSPNSLTSLVLEVRQYPVGSSKQQRLLTQIIRQMQQSGKIWRDYRISTEHYQDALQQTWVWFYQNHHNYDPAQASVMTWFNCTLKYRIKDVLRAAKTYQEHVLISDQLEILDNTNNLLAPQSDDPLQLLEETLAWLHQERDRLKQMTIRNHPNIDAYTLILRRLPTDQQATWDALAAEFGVAIPTLSSFYQRKCLPLLREFGRRQGWIDEALAA